MDLRPYQTSAVLKVMNAFQSRHQGVFLMMPTGAGKTPTGCAIISKFQESNPDIKVLFLAHRTLLLDQASNKLTTWGIEHGIIQASRNTNPSANVQVASRQTITSQDLPFIPELIVVDEAHTAMSESYLNILTEAPLAKRLLLSATPKRGDGQGFKDIASELIIGASVQELIEADYLVEPLYFIEKGDPVNAYEKCGKGKKTVIFAEDKAHCWELVKAFKAVGIQVEGITSEDTNENERCRILSAFIEGNLQVLVNVDICSEGFDFPELEAVMLSVPMQSEILYLQRVGRVLRPAPGKKFGRIIDLGGNYHRFGSVDKDREWSLDAALKPMLDLNIVYELRTATPESELRSIRDNYWKAYNDARQKFGTDKYKLTLSAIGKMQSKSHSTEIIIAALWETGTSPIIPAPIKNKYQIIPLSAEKKAEIRSNKAG